jgi:TRAP-type C4-dicarboxylate transport system substrate-binding protein
LAGLFNDTEHARRVVLVPEVRKALADIAQSRGLVLLGINAYDMQKMVFKTAVNSLADLSGRRMRVLATESEQAMIKALGASPVPMSLPEVLPALQQGTLDGATAVLGVYVAFRYYDVTPYLLDSHLWPVISVSFVSRAFYSRLPPDLQKTVMETGAKVETEINKWQINRLITEMDTWKSSGGKVAAFSPAEQEEARRRATAAIQPILDKDASLKQFYELVKVSADKVK